MTEILYNEITNEFKKENYQEVVKLFKKHIQNKNAGIDDYLLYVYTTSLVKLGLNYDAVKNLKVLYEINITKNNKFDLALSYFKINDYDNALKLFYELLKEEPNNYKMYYYIAKTYMLIGNYKTAKEILLNKRFYFDDQTKEDSYRLISAIDKHLIYDSFIQMDYNLFKEKGNELSNGYVVTLKDHSNYLNETDNYSVNTKRPYLIWRNNKNVYGLLINSINTHDITSDDITNSFIKIDEKNISVVLDQVKEETYEQIFKDIYRRIFYYGNNEEKDKYSPFIQGMKNNFDINEGNVIAFRGNNNSYNYYYITKINDNNTYKTIEVTTNDEFIFNFKEKNPTPVTIKKDRNMFKLIKIDSMEKRKLNRQIPECFTTDTLEGKIVRKDNQETIILLKNNSDYIGIDRIFSNSFMAINIIPEDTYVDIIDVLDKDEYLNILKLFYQSNMENSKTAKPKIKYRLIENKIEEEQSN